MSLSKCSPLKRGGILTRLSPKYYLKSKAKFRRKIFLTCALLFLVGASVPNYNEWPLQFLRTGYYNRSYGYLHVRTTSGLWWSATAGSATGGRHLNTWTGGVGAQDRNFRGYGFALRCVATCNGVTSWGCG